MTIDSWNKIAEESQEEVRGHSGSKWTPTQIQMVETILKGPQYWNDRQLNDMYSIEQQQATIKMSKFLDSKSLFL